MDRIDERLADARPFDELTGPPARATRRSGCGCPSCSRCRPPRSRSSATSCRSDRAGARPARPAATVSTTRCGSRTASDRMGARRRPRARDRRRLRPRARAPLGRRRHAARHREPVDDRAAWRDEPPTSTDGLEGGGTHDRPAALRNHLPVRRHAAARAARARPRARRPRLHRPVVGRVGRLRRLHPARRRRAVGARAAARHRDRARVHTRRAHARVDGRERCAKPRPGASRSASARRRT